LDSRKEALRRIWTFAGAKASEAAGVLLIIAPYDIVAVEGVLEGVREKLRIPSQKTAKDVMKDIDLRNAEFPGVLPPTLAQASVGNTGSVSPLKSRLVPRPFCSSRSF